MSSDDPKRRKKFTYSGDPSDSPLDAVRFYCQDTVKEDAIFNDREILFTIAENPNLRVAAAVCLETAAKKFSRLPKTLKAGPLSKTYGERVDDMLMLAKDLRRKVSYAALPFFGGISQAGKDSLSQDSDDVAPPFTRDQFDSPRANQFDGTSPNQNDWDD